ncbi:Oxygen tolerance [Loktanella atrilutea]|uniref:Oxygen tolerance n=1 Tax=Loktanella atrilutea TaxID=366533 RepID=A0A1M4ZK22_LOKAT|nr:BatD family protein [Loktanella atrilutea]SHF18364.1 Oxygen tolerance [Loktanella atrilutea]
MVRLFALLLLLCGPALAQDAPVMKMSIIADPGHETSVVGEMIPLTIRAVYDLKVANEKLEILGTGSFDWIQTGPDDWHEEMIGGLSRIVMERHVAVWPKQSGMVTFGPVVHHLTVIDRQSRRQDMDVTAQPLALSVGAFPMDRGWHLAAEAVELTDELSADAGHLPDGATVIRKVTLRALGALPEQLPPRPVVSENWLITFAAPIQRDLFLTEDGPVAQVVWTWEFRPHTGEPGVLEGVTIPYFNATTRRLDSVEIPALPIAVASFFDAQTLTGVIAGRQVWVLAGLALGGLILGLAVAALWLAPDATTAGWARLRRRWSPLPRLRLWRARRRGDLLAERRAAQDAGLPQARLAALDRRIYGPGGS